MTAIYTPPLGVNASTILRAAEHCINVRRESRITASRRESRITASRRESRITALRRESRITASRRESRITALRRESRITASRRESRITALRRESRITASRRESRITALRRESRITASRRESRITALRRESRITASRRESRITAFRRESRITALRRESRITALRRESRITAFRRESSVYIRADSAGPQVHWITEMQSKCFAITTDNRLLCRIYGPNAVISPSSLSGKEKAFRASQRVFTCVKPVGGLCGKWAEMSDWSVTEVKGAHIYLSKVSYTQEMGERIAPVSRCYFYPP